MTPLLAFSKPGMCALGRPLDDLTAGHLARRRCHVAVIFNQNSSLLHPNVAPRFNIEPPISPDDTLAPYLEKVDTPVFAKISRDLSEEEDAFLAATLPLKV